MSALALAFVLVSAVLHASWNLLAKRAAGGVGFVWLFSVATLAIYGPPALLFALVTGAPFAAVHLGAAAVSSVLHVGYFAFLQRAYRGGDLSLVYPLARGSGPALATLLAVVLLGERPGPQAFAGTALVVVGVFVLTGGRGLAERAGRVAAGYGLVTGLFIGGYTVWDAFAVAHLGASPLPYLVVAECGRALLLTPAAFARRSEVTATWRRFRREALAIAVLSPLAYLLVLLAMQHAPISLVAPTREISILLTTVMGSKLLAEGEGGRRAVAAVAMVVGVALLATA